MFSSLNSYFGVQYHNCTTQGVVATVQYKKFCSEVHWNRFNWNLKTLLRNVCIIFPVMIRYGTVTCSMHDTVNLHVPNLHRHTNPVIFSKDSSIIVSIAPCRAVHFPLNFSFSVILSYSIFLRSIRATTLVCAVPYQRRNLTFVCHDSCTVYCATALYCTASSQCTTVLYCLTQMQLGTVLDRTTSMLNEL